MFASKSAAIGDKYADASIGNVTGSNAVNVFLGIGVAWSIAAIYHAFVPSQSGGVFRVDPGSLGFSVTLFTLFALLAVSLLMLRRKYAMYDTDPKTGGELGGPKKWKIGTTAFFFSIWFLYIFLCSLQSYGHIKGF